MKCVEVGCQRHEDCGDKEICNLSSQKCLPLCSRSPCAVGATCSAANHNEFCTCDPPLQGDGNVFCERRKVFWYYRFISKSIKKFSAIQPVLEECYIDSDCRAGLACLNNFCIDPCQRQNPCNRDQICHVFNTTPTRTVTCSCPEGTYIGHNGRCATGR